MSREERAYYLWEKAGRPEGRDLEFWEQAKEAELREALRFRRTEFLAQKQQREQDRVTRFQQELMAEPRENITSIGKQLFSKVLWKIRRAIG